MAKRRGHGEGSIYRRKDGRWAGSVEVPAGQGRRLRKTVYGKTRSEVQKKLSDARRAVEDGRPVPNDRLTLEKYLDWWIAEHVPGRVRPRTLLSYEQKVRHVARLLGRVRLWTLTATQVESAFNQLLDEGHSPGGVQAIRRVFRVAMKEADRKDLVRKNVVALADGPKAVDKPRDPFTVAEIQAIRGAMEQDSLLPLFFVGLALGLREGEAFGLMWSDVDLKRGLVHIRQQVQPKRGGGFEFDDPKTSASMASLELTKNQVAILRRHRKQQATERLITGSDWVDYDLVFPSAVGTPYSASNVRRRFNRICEDAGVRPRRIHDWRVTAGSWLADLNVHPEVAKQVLRHSQHGTTMKYYTHAKSERRGEALKALDELFNG